MVGSPFTFLKYSSICFVFPSSLGFDFFLDFFDFPESSFSLLLSLINGSDPLVDFLFVGFRPLGFVALEDFFVLAFMASK